MKKQYFLWFLLVLTTATASAQCPGAGCPPPPTGLQGQALRTWLKQNYYDGKHNSLGYTEARRRMYNLIDNNSASAPNSANYGDATTYNKIFCVYGGHSVNVTYGGTVTNPDPINCEHTVPQSFFNEAAIPKADIHHLFPTLAEWNSTRSNYPFADIVDAQTTKWMRLTGSQTTIPTTLIEEYSEYKSTGTRVFEPREDHKGNVARAVFYFYTMYPTIAGDISRVADPATLYAWHLADPVDNRERERNNRVQTAQGNRNPYIDHPDAVAAAWGFAAPAPTQPTVNFASMGGQINEGNTGTQNYSVAINVAPALSGTATGSVRVEIDPTGTTAIQGIDFTFSPVTLNFSASVSSQNVSIGVIGNTIASGSKTVKLRLVNITGLEQGFTNTHTLTIKEDEKIITPIAEIKTIDANGVLTRLNEEVIIRGVTHGVNTNNQFANNGLQFAVIDNTGGIIVFYCVGSAGCSPIKDENGNDYVFAEGDEVEIQGLVSQFNGLAQFSPTTITKISTKPIKQPTIVDNVNESTESNWIKMENLEYVSGWGGTPFTNRDINSAIFKTPAGTNITVRVDKETDVDNTIQPTVGQKYTIVGLGGQFDNTSPYDGGYQLQPQRASDMVLVATPPPNHVQFAIASASVNETLTGSQTYTIQVIANNVITGGFSVPFTISGTATNGTDYTISTSSPLTFSATEMAKTITITINGDAILESPNETIILTLGTPTGTTPPTLGTNSTHTITIIDAGTIPAVSVQFPTTEGSIQEESSGTSTYEINIIASSTTPNGFTLPFTITGTATQGVDYTITPASPLTFSSTEVIKTITITINSDAIVENPNETIILTLGTPTGTNPPVLGANTTHTITILDAPVVATGLEFQSSTLSLTEGESSEVTISIPQPPTQNANLIIEATFGDGLKETDFTSNPLVVNKKIALQVPAGANTLKIKVEALRDAEQESTETLTLKLSASSSLPIGINNQVIINIADGEPLALESQLAEQIKLYPNPTAELVFLQVPFPVYQVEVTDLVGKKILVGKNNTQLNVKDLSEGLYLVHIRSLEGAIIKKLVVKK